MEEAASLRSEANPQTFGRHLELLTVQAPKEVGARARQYLVEQLLSEDELQLDIDLRRGQPNEP